MHDGRRGRERPVHGGMARRRPIGRSGRDRVQLRHHCQQAEGLQENAYKVINAETWTLKQAINAAKTIDFTVVGKYICDGIAAGILGNKQVVINFNILKIFTLSHVNINMP